MLQAGIEYDYEGLNASVGQAAKKSTKAGGDPPTKTATMAEAATSRTAPPAASKAVKRIKAKTPHAK